MQRVVLAEGSCSERCWEGPQERPSHITDTVKEQTNKTQGQRNGGSICPVSHSSY